jgi:predicted nucleotidyltransferase component of viral defense system
MPFLDEYRRQVRLLMRLLPIVAQEPCFALKGGTAINLFIRDLPRLSVDIDLVYLPLHVRADALAGIDKAMKRTERKALAAIPAARSTRHVSENAVVRLLIHADGSQVKIEVSPVLRGVVRDPTVMQVTEGVEAAFGFAETNVVSFDDLYAGKLVAALDRQHPRDFFDVRWLLGPTATAAF